MSYSGSWAHNRETLVENMWKTAKFRGSTAFVCLARVTEENGEKSYYMQM